MKQQRRRFIVMRTEARDVMGKFKKVMDEKSTLEAKVEELNWRLTAEARAKARSVEQLEEAERELVSLREQLEAARKVRTGRERGRERGRDDVVFGGFQLSCF